MPLSRGRVLIRFVAMTAAALLVVLVYRRILHVNQTTVALTFLVMVQVAALGWGLIFSVCLSLLCTLLYNLFFPSPHWQLYHCRPAKLDRVIGLSGIGHFHQQALRK